MRRCLNFHSGEFRDVISNYEAAAEQEHEIFFITLAEQNLAFLSLVGFLTDIRLFFFGIVLELFFHRSFTALSGHNNRRNFWMKVNITVDPA